MRRNSHAPLSSNPSSEVVNSIAGFGTALDARLFGLISGCSMTLDPSLRTGTPSHFFSSHIRNMYLTQRCIWILPHVRHYVGVSLPLLPRLRWFRFLLSMTIACPLLCTGFLQVANVSIEVITQSHRMIGVLKMIPKDEGPTHRRICIVLSTSISKSPENRFPPFPQLAYIRHHSSYVTKRPEKNRG